MAGVNYTWMCLTEKLKKIKNAKMDANNDKYKTKKKNQHYAVMVIKVRHLIKMTNEAPEKDD